MIKKFSSPKIEYKLVAEARKTNQDPLTFPFWCSREELNLCFKLRRLVFYPLNYESGSNLLKSDFHKFSLKMFCDGSGIFHAFVSSHNAVLCHSLYVFQSRIADISRRISTSADLW